MTKALNNKPSTVETHRNERAGFTLVELISTLVIIAILTAIAAPKFTAMSDEAKRKAISAGIAEFNVRDKQLWELYIIRQDPTVLVTDASLNNRIYADMDGYLDPDKVGGNSNGSSQGGDNWTYTHGYPYPPNNQTVHSTLSFKQIIANVIREPATLNNPAKWKIVSFAN